MTNKNIGQQPFLEKLGISSLNPMQISANESIQQNNKVILLSNTGSGKTIAFLMPLLGSLKTNISYTQALIVVPSRELALQIEDVLKKMQTGFKITACYGGHKREIEENNLVEPPTILVATPGRLGDHIRRKNVDLSKVHFLVLDEFDKCLELGFQEEIEFIIQSLPAIEKRMLISATYASAIPDFVDMNDAATANFLAPEANKSEKLNIRVVNSPENDKLDSLLKLVCFVRNTSTIIFCNHRDAVERTSKFLSENGIINVFYHGGMEQHEREVALVKFKNGSSDILVTTDLASRGLDIANIRSIIHYHLPANEEAFTHRNGRTARMNATGNVYLLVNPVEEVLDYAKEMAEELKLKDDLEIPDKPKWSTIFIAAGKKDKVNKIDVVGFLSNKGKLKKDEIGLVEIKDFASFAAVRKSKIGHVVELVKNEKIKNKKVKIAVAK
ncbi:MAG: DEAD/DEAH box helicase [Bacteroidetes bacterium]|nr:DEAD/DEAH box helicase [Bacteroidota bacterium]